MAAVVHALYWRRQLRRNHVFRDKLNPLDVYDDIELFERFRFGRIDILRIVEEIRADLTFSNLRFRHRTRRSHHRRRPSPLARRRSEQTLRRKYPQSSPCKGFLSASAPTRAGVLSFSQIGASLAGKRLPFFFNSSGLRRDDDTAFTSAVRASHASFLSLFVRVDLNRPCRMSFRRP